MFQGQSGFDIEVTGNNSNFSGMRSKRQVTEPTCNVFEELKSNPICKDFELDLARHVNY